MRYTVKINYHEYTFKVEAEAIAFAKFWDVKY